MQDSPLSHEDVDRILRIVDSAPEVAAFHMKFGEVEIELGSAPAAVAAQPPQAAQAAQAAQAPAAAPALPGPVPAAVPSAPVASAALPPGAVAVKAPMVGTFYHAPEPGARPFVAVGQTVTRETIVCIIEVMKLMHSVPAGCDGVVRAILAGDGEPVEYGQPLVVIEPPAR